MSRVMRCVQHPPLPGEEGVDTASLQVMHILNAGDGKDSQVFTVQVLESTSSLLPPRGTRLVAKVYDPLYSDDKGGSVNPFSCMDHDYTRETHTYLSVPDMQGHQVPKYYGSYSLCLPVEQGYTRTVRMILTEHIPDINMGGAEPGVFPQSVRQHVMKSIVELDCEIFGRGIVLRDVNPCNVILQSPESDHPHVMFFDFADVVFNRRPDDPNAPEGRYFLGAPISPLLRWKLASERPCLFEDWIDWDWNSWLDAEFAHTVASITPRLRETWSLWVGPAPPS